jgi:putative N6-adenine-specific DNA methylase
VRIRPQTFFAVCVPGFEGVLEAEVSALASAAPEADITLIETARGGVQFTGHLDCLYYAHLHLYSATRVLWRVRSFLAQSLPMLFDKARKVPWEYYLAFADAYTIRVSAKMSRLNHQRSVADSVSQAISRALSPHGLTPQYLEKIDPERIHKTLEIHVRLFQDTCTLSINSSGDHLYKRGYRSLPHPAPLRETLASSLLQYLDVASYDTFLDPMCGSGTLPIEAALLCRQVPAGYNHDAPRPYAFEQLPTFQASKWQRLRREALEASKPCSLQILAGDKHADAVAMTTQHAFDAGIGEALNVVKRDARAWLADPVALKGAALKGRTLIFCNAPYGKRLQDAEDATTLQALQQQVHAARTAEHDISLAVITSPRIAQKLEGFTSLKRFRNGGLTVVLLRA